MQMMKLTLKKKILLGTVIIFFALSSLITAFTETHEQEMIKKLAISEAQQIAKSYFDLLNTLMLTGMMNEKENIRNKILGNTNVKGLRLIRSSHITGTFGKGSVEQQVQDDLDQRALEGNSLIELKAGDQGHVLTVLVPISASKNMNGTNCLGCHAVSEGTILGAVRVDYSLLEFDQMITDNIRTIESISALLFLVTVALAYWFTHKLMQKLGGEPDYTVGVVKQIAEGNLDVQILLKPNDRQSILFVVNCMKEQLFTVVKTVLDSADGLANVAKNVLTNTHIQNEYAVKQKNQIERICLDIDKLRNTVEKNVENAEKTTRSALDSVQDVCSGVDSVQKIMGSMQNVVDKTVLIEDIAHKTNILSLNAAIEAANAGTYGKGFAVVATEVRKLSDYSKITANEIDFLTKGCLSTTKDTSDLFNLLIPNLRHTVDSITNIAKASQEQAQTISLIYQTINEINQVAQNNSIMSSSLAQTSESMDRQAKQLQQVVAFFKFKEDQDG